MGTYPNYDVCPKCDQQGTIKIMKAEGLCWKQCMNCPWETVTRVDVARVE